MGCITPKNNGNIRFCTRTHLSLYHIPYKRVSKETRKSLCYGGLLRTGWYVRNRVYVYSSDRGGDGRIYMHVMLALPSVPLMCLNCFKPKGEISYTFPCKVYERSHAVYNNY